MLTGFAFLYILCTRWINLWWPAQFADQVTSDSCTLGAGASGLGFPVFVGNVVLVVGILLSIFLLHVMLVSAVEAYWMAKVRYTRRFQLSVASIDNIMSTHVIGVMLWNEQRHCSERGIHRSFTIGGI